MLHLCFLPCVAKMPLAVYRVCCCMAHQGQARRCWRVLWLTTQTAPSSVSVAVSWCRSTLVKAHAWCESSLSWPGEENRPGWQQVWSAAGDVHMWPIHAAALCRSSGALNPACCVAVAGQNCGQLELCRDLGALWGITRCAYGSSLDSCTPVLCGIMLLLCMCATGSTPPPSSSWTRLTLLAVHAQRTAAAAATVKCSGRCWSCSISWTGLRPATKSRCDRTHTCLLILT